MCEQTTLRCAGRHIFPLPSVIGHSCKITGIYWSVGGLPPVQTQNHVFLPLPPSFFFGCSCAWGGVYVGKCMSVRSPPTAALAESSEMELSSPLAH